MKHEPGTIIHGKIDLGSTFAEGEILGSINHHGYDKYIIQVIKSLPGSSLTIDSIVLKSEGVIESYYYVKPSFFEVGKTYEPNYSVWGYEYLIVDIYYNENPLSPHLASQALASKTLGNESMFSLLNMDDFKNMKVVR